MRDGNVPTLDDHHRKGGARWRCLEQNNWLNFLDVRCRRRNMLVVRMAQGCPMVTHHQGKIIIQFGQGAALHASNLDRPQRRGFAADKPNAKRRQAY